MIELRGQVCRTTPSPAQRTKHLMALLLPPPKATRTMLKPANTNEGSPLCACTFFLFVADKCRILDAPCLLESIPSLPSDRIQPDGQPIVRKNASKHPLSFDVCRRYQELYHFKGDSCGATEGAQTLSCTTVCLRLHKLVSLKSERLATFGIRSVPALHSSARAHLSHCDAWTVFRVQLETTEHADG